MSISIQISCGVILVIIATIIAWFAWHRRRETTSYKTTPRQKEAVTNLSAVLLRISVLGHEFSGYGDRSTLRESVMKITNITDKTYEQITTTDPSYANYHALYKGLASSDDAMLLAADAYTAAGKSMALNKDDSTTTPTAHAIYTVNALGTQIRSLVRATHRLGDALELE